MKIMKKVFSLLSVFLLLLLSSCKSLSPNTVSNQIVKAIENQQETTKPTDTTTSSTTSEAEASLSWETKYYNGEGYLQILVNNPRVIRSIDQLSLSGFSSNESHVAVYGNSINDPITEYSFPSFIMENGTFIDPISLVLADVTITSYEAKNGGRYENPYVFNVNVVGSLIDPDGNMWNPDAPSLRYEVDYFSEMNSCEENFLAFSLEPGATISFQIGWLLGNNVDGNPIDFSDFRLGNDSLSFPLNILEE